jgi:hypothetical protein
VNIEGLARILQAMPQLEHISCVFMVLDQAPITGCFSTLLINIHSTLSEVGCLMHSKDVCSGPSLEGLIERSVAEVRDPFVDRLAGIAKQRKPCASVAQREAHRLRGRDGIGAPEDCMVYR